MSGQQRKATDILFTTEPVWVFTALAATLLSVILGIEDPWIWIALAVVLLPFPLRFWRYHRLSLSTPFDIPIIIFFAGLLVGLGVSDDLELSLKAFATFVACVSFYYTLVNYPQPGYLLKLALPIYALVIATVAIIALVEGPSSYSTFGPSGLALNMMVIAAIILGAGTLSRRNLIRATAIPAGLFFAGAAVVQNQASLASFFTGTSFQSRMPLWEGTIDMMTGYHTFTGIGLGYWAAAYNSGIILPESSHPHNAYLQLWADAGMLGAFALILAVIIAVGLSWRILRSRLDSPWYGAGIGVIMAVATTVIASTVINASFGIPSLNGESYTYLASPMAWFLAGMLAIVYRKLRDDKSHL